MSCRGAPLLKILVLEICEGPGFWLVFLNFEKFCYIMEYEIVVGVPFFIFVSKMSTVKSI